MPNQAKSPPVLLILLIQVLLILVDLMTGNGRNYYRRLPLRVFISVEHLSLSFSCLYVYK